MVPSPVQESLSEKPEFSLEPLFQEYWQPSRLSLSLQNPFARTDALLGPSVEKQGSDSRSRIASAAAPRKHIGEPLSYEQYLHAQRDEATEQGINFRQTGVIFENLRVSGLGAVVQYQETIFSALNPLRIFDVIKKIRYPPVKSILSGFEGVVRPGEMLLVLGRPGSGCSTFLKILANQRAGFHAIDGTVSYDGITPEYMAKHYRGDIGYCPEDDIHFPSLSVRQTLNVPATARAPKTHLADDARSQYTKNVVDVLAAVFGLTHAFDTPVGDQNIRGVSGGEKKRVSIAEMMSMRLAVVCWDNSTRGLDSSTALEFTQAIRTASDIAKVTTIASIYQASENIYKLFDKVAVIDEGHMSYFGPADQARDYFIKMGYQPYNRQTTADFLVGVTHSLSRTTRPGFELRVPRTPQEFAEYFANSPLGQENSRAVQDQLCTTPVDNKASNSTNQASARAERAKHLPPGSPYNISLAMQVRTLIRRRVHIILGDAATQVIIAFNFVVQAVLVGSLFLKMPNATDAYYSRGGALFFAVLSNALSSMAEIPILYSQRPIVSRHHKQALYHPFIDAFAFTIVDIPITFIITMVFNIAFYFMTGLQRHASNFFIFILFTISATLMMKAFFRGLTASFRIEAAAQALAGVAMLVLVIYTGFVAPKPGIIGALRWIAYINPVNYAFAGLVANEFHGLNGQCSELIPSGPGYEGVDLANQVCTTVGSLPGQSAVNGERFIEMSYAYKYSDLWPNFGITMAFWIGFVAWYLYGTERVGSHSSGPTQLVFKRGSEIPEAVHAAQDVETGSPMSSVNDSSVRNSQAETARDALPNPRGVFSWHHLTMDLSGGKTRRLLDDVSGFVTPGKLTALMGESGAGKTTLLNALAGRLRIGVITGDRFVNGGPLPPDFAVQTGYCQQMDIHLETTTVREALRFSAILRQPSSVSREEKYKYVEEVIRMCNMEAYADAVVGLVGQGLNVEQRKRLTIGVELAAKPQLLLLLDEPTSGLESDSAWAIIDLLKSLAGSGQAILCTIHQPSAELFQVFDKLLLLCKGGKTCYFGDIGNNATTLIQYFERNGGRECKEGENPAEYMLDVIGAGATAHTEIDWYTIWRNSQEREEMEAGLNRILQLSKDTPPAAAQGVHSEFTASFSIQFRELTRRAFQNYIRSSTYLLSKILINVFGGLLLGFTFFKSDNSSQGLQNKLFASFMALMLGSPHSNMLQGPFLNFRKLFEAREQASKAYHWIPLITTSLVVELPFNVIGASLFFVCWYWSVGFPGATQRVGFQYLIYCVIYPLYYTTLSQAVASMTSNPEVAGLTFASTFSLAFAFSGILQPFSQLVPFWHWLYRLSPLTYLVEALVTNGVGNQALQCSEAEVVAVVPPSGQTCQAYMQKYIDRAGGYLLNLTDESNCQFCSASSTDQFLASFNMSFSHRWRNVALLTAYIVFNTTLIYVFTYLFRIRTGSLRSILTRHLKKSN